MATFPRYAIYYVSAPGSDLDGFGARVRGEIVVAIADDDHDAANDVGLVTSGTRRMIDLLHHESR